MADRTLPRPVRQTPGWMAWGRRIFPVLLLVLAVWPRLVGLDRYITPDELIWVYRSLQFREALLDGRWADTLVAGHPGVTTTWLGTAGLSLQLLFSPDSQEPYRWLTHLPFLRPDNVAAYIRLAEFLSMSRVLVALVNSLGIVLIYLLVRRVWGTSAAIIGSLFLAFDPFLVGLSGLFHVDALSATFATLSLVLFAFSFNRGVPRQRIWLATSGIATGLAILTKTPTIMLIPVLALALMIVWAGKRERTVGKRIGGFVLDSLVLGSAVGMTIVLLYPALWVSTSSVLSTVFGSANRHLGEALRETFFLGHVAYNHGPLFYPVVLAWRVSPVFWLSIIPLLFLLVQGIKTSNWTFFRGKGLALLLLLWSITFLVAITPAAKKFDRYILPVVPALLLLAGYVWAVWGEYNPKPAKWAITAIVVVQAVFWLVFAAYPLAAYNPLVGGPQTAARVLPVGWGEGISAAGRWLANSQVDSANTGAIAGIAPSLAAFFPGRTLVAGVDDPQTATYVIVTMGGRQLDPAGVADQTKGLELVQTIRYGGLDQAWIYRREDPQPVSPPSSLADPVVFDGRIALSAIEPKVEDDTITLSASWQRLVPLADDERFTVRLTVVDEEGNIWAASENDILNEVDFYPANWELDQTAPVRYDLEMNPATPPGRYKLRLSLVDNRTAGQLPIRIGSKGFSGVVYEIGAIDLPLPESIVSASRVQIPVTSSDKWLDNSLWLLGHSPIQSDVLAGSDLPVELFWHAPTGGLPEDISIEWSLRPADGGPVVPLLTTPISRFDSGQWRVGETIHERYRLPIPPVTRPGKYSLSAQPLTTGGALLDAPATLAELTVNNIDRSYAVPETMDVSLDTSFGELFCLRGTDLPPTTIQAGQQFDITFYWQTLSEPEKVYTVFTHLVDEAGEIVLQADHWPGGLPSDILDAGQVITDRVTIALPPELPPGSYSLNVGFYDPENGQRLAISPEVDATDFLRLPFQINVTSP